LTQYDEHLCSHSWPPAIHSFSSLSLLLNPLPYFVRMLSSLNLSIPTSAGKSFRQGCRNQFEADAQASPSSTKSGTSTKSTTSTKSPTSSSELSSFSTRGAALGKSSPNEGIGAQSGAPTQTRLRSKASLFVPGCSVPPPPVPLFVPGCSVPPPPAPHFPPPVPLFVPGCAVPPPPAPLASQGAKVAIRCVIEGAFGNRLTGMNMVDTPSGSQTDVEVTVLATREDMYAPVTEARSRALYTLLHAFKILGSQIKSLEPSTDESQLHIKYSEASPDRMCWQFGQYGYCPRQHVCRWEHIAMESFVISLVMQPLPLGGSPANPQVMPPQVTDYPGGMDGYSPVAGTNYVQDSSGMVYCPVPVQLAVAPMPMQSNFTGMVPICNGEQAALENGVADPENYPENSTAPGNSPVSGSSERSGSTSPPVSSVTPTGSRVCWADIEDDDDDIPDCPGDGWMSG